MPYEPIHHKYRPQTFKDLVGQETIALTLTNALKQERIATAYLLTGPRGTGKTSSARILAKSLNCLTSDRPTPDPCGKCEACLAIAKGSALDVMEIDAASNTGVDNIREIIERSRFAPVQCRYKVYAIDECHMLSTAAFNALLKTLEEPPPQVVFILATTDPQRVLSTIISRCQRFDYRRIPLPAMVNHLKYIARSENIAIADDALTLIAQIANGGLRDAESLLDQLSLLPDRISVEKVWDLVGAVPEQDLLKLLHAINSNDSIVVLQQCRSLLDRGREPIVVLQNLASFYLNLLIAKTAPQHPEMVAVTETCWQQLCNEGANWDTSLILRGQQHLKEAEIQLKRTTQPRLWLEVTLLGLLPEANRVVNTQVPTVDVPKAVNNISPQATTPAKQPQPTQVTTPQSTTVTEKPPELPATKLPEVKSASAASVRVQSVRLPEPEAIPPAQQPSAASNFEIEEIWNKVVSCLHPPTTQALLKQQCHLVDFDGSSAIVDISSGRLQTLHQGKIPNIEKAFAGVIGQKVKVQLEVASSKNSAGKSAKKNSKALSNPNNAVPTINPPPAPTIATPIETKKINFTEPKPEPKTIAPPPISNSVAAPPPNLDKNSSATELSPGVIQPADNSFVDPINTVDLDSDYADTDYEDDELRKAMQRGLGRGVQAPEINSGDSPLAFPHERLLQEAIANLTHSFEGELVEMERTLDEDGDLVESEEIVSTKKRDNGRPSIEDYDDDW